MSRHRNKIFGMPRRPPRTSRSPPRVLRAREKKAWLVAFYITVAHSHRPPRVLSGSDGDAQTLRIRKEYTGRGGPRRRPDERLSWYSSRRSWRRTWRCAACAVPIYRRGAVPAQRGAERSATVATVAFHTFFTKVEPSTADTPRCATAQEMTETDGGHVPTPRAKQT